MSSDYGERFTIFRSALDRYSSKLDRYSSKLDRRIQQLRKAAMRTAARAALRSGSSKDTAAVVRGNVEGRNEP